ncbi:MULTISPECIES: hypothetical protein [Methylobacterium]|uniref:hypothetical protein n=1 Tax=Methylobacterium TaxID=407 RepID=UPI0013EDAC85|nr:hypothetical protein [Methylobacterium sp. DB0501]NGM36990.1 hypothetical protein [Methylobacterium sp. DB0501]
MPDTSDQAAAWTDDVATPALVRRIAALLDRDGRALAATGLLPRGWHVALCHDGVPQGRLPPDGYAGPGIALPDLGLPRVMLGGRRATFTGDIPLGATVERCAGIVGVTEKTGRSGRFALVTIRHAYTVQGREAVVEEADYVLREAASPEALPPPSPPPAPRKAEVARIVVPDETLLFRFSAVTGNPHRIHYDAPYARDREGYPALVVNGGLTALLVLDLVRHAAGREPAVFACRMRRPLFCGRPMRLCASPDPEGWRAVAEDETGAVALEAEFR